MPMINADDGCPIHVEVEGREGAPVLMLSNSLGTNLHMWDDQTPECAKHFRAGALRPPRPRQIRRAERPLLHGALRPRRARRARRAQDQEDPIGAACRWAAWSGNGWAPMRPTGSRNSCCPTPISITPTRRRGTTASSSCRKKVSANWSIRTWSAGSPRISAIARRKRSRA